MDFLNTDSSFYIWVVIPGMLFVARILDVSIGTIRIILISKGYRALAPILGFVEAFVWVVAVSQVMANLNNFFYYIAYAGGFATGTYVGIWIEHKLSLGKVIVRVITNRDASELLHHLRNEEFAVTSVDAEGKYGAVKILFLICNRKSLSDVVDTIKEYNPKAFYTVEDLRLVSGGVMPTQSVFSRKTKNNKKAFNIRK
jgi:uncharacterized protein YebE (UPF0316 family)